MVETSNVDDDNGATWEHSAAHHKKTIRNHADNLKLEFRRQLGPKKPQTHYTHEAHAIAFGEIIADAAPLLGLDVDKLLPLTKTAGSKIVGNLQSGFDPAGEAFATDLLTKLFDLVGNGEARKPEKAGAIAALGRIAVHKLNDMQGRRSLDESVRKIGERNLANGFSRGY